MAEILSPEKVHFSGSKVPNSHRDLCNLWTEVHLTFFIERRRNRSGNISFPILDIFSRFGDIRDQSRKLYKIDRTFACGPNFWTWIRKFSQFPIVWQSFSRGTSDNAWRNKKKHLRKNRSPSGTVVPGSLNIMIIFSNPGPSSPVQFLPFFSTTPAFIESVYSTQECHTPDVKAVIAHAKPSVSIAAGDIT